MLIGASPGSQEDLEGRPFIGKAGKKLDLFLKTPNIKRDKIFIERLWRTVKYEGIYRAGVSPHGGIIERRKCLKTG